MYNSWEYVIGYTSMLLKGAWVDHEEHKEVCELLYCCS